ncbi:MAG: hypothetical protein HY901_17515 [Deltaproteobacteria bacterium]|nr:hypothetical protein [Deltaproteobacteria bacterium]
MARRYAQDEMEQFLRQVDAELARPCTIVLIGGAALSLGYHSSHATTDMDLWSPSRGPFWTAVEKVKKRDPASVPIERAAIAEPPYNFEDRLVSLELKGLARLSVQIPEAHDLVLLKTARAEAHDLDAVEDIHRTHPLSLETLIERYRETLPQVMGPKSRFKLNFLAVVARLFGEDEALELEKRL